MDGRSQSMGTLAAVTLGATTLAAYALLVAVEAALGRGTLAPSALIAAGSLAVVVGLAAHIVLAAARGYLSTLWPGLIFPVAFFLFHFASLGELEHGWYREDLLPLAWLLSAVCLLTWMCGHALARGALPQRPATGAALGLDRLGRDDLRRLAGFGAACFILGLTAQLVMLSRIGLTNIFTVSYYAWRSSFLEAGAGVAAAYLFSVMLCFVGLALSCTGSALADRKLFIHPAVTVAFVIYALLLVMAGDRSELANVVLALLLVRHHLVRPIPVRNAVIIAVLSTMAFGGIKFYRATKDVGVLVDSATDTEVLITKNRTETGTTLDTVVRSMELVPDKFEYFGGWTYVSAVQRVVPKVLVPGGDDFVSSVWLTQQTTEQRTLAKGGTGFSVVAEAYINFGASLAPFVLLAFGALHGRLETWLSGPTIDPRRFALFLCIHAAFLLHVRNSVVVYVRGGLWATALTLGLFFVYWALFRTRGVAGARASAQADSSTASTGR